MINQIRIQLFALCTCLLIAVSCTDEEINKEENQTYENAAELIQRTDRIQLGKEWDSVQNQYSDLTKKIAAKPHDNESKVALAQLYIREARVTGEHGHYYPAALATLDDALNDKELKDEMKFIALMTKAGVQLSLHDFGDALKTGNSAALLNPSNAQIHGVLIDANVELGNYSKAVALSDKMMSIKPDLRSYSRVSYLREIHGDIDGAIQAMRMAVKAGYPGTEETAWAMLTLGDLYREYGKLDEAKSIYKNILDLRADYPFAIGGLGDLYVEEGKLELAEKTLLDASQVIPEVGFYISLAKLYKDQGRADESEKLIEEIKVMLKEDTDSGHNMNLEYADLYLEIENNPNIALKYATEEYNKRPLNIDVNRMMAKIKIELGDNAGAKDNLLAASVTNSKKPELVELMGKI